MFGRLAIFPVLRVAGVLLGLVFSSLPCRVSAAAPNVVWIVLHGAGPQLGCYGDPHANTPQMDAFAAQGMRYRAAYSVAGTAAPVRAALWTGLYPASFGAQHERCAALLTQGHQTLPVLLRLEGYFCSNTDPGRANFTVPEESWTDFGPDSHWRNRGDKSQPFFSVFHVDAGTEARFRDEESGARVTADLAESSRANPYALTTFPPYYPDTALSRRDWARYYDCLAAADRGVGRILSQLSEDGLANETLVILFADHGPGLPRAERWLLDSGVHVPLLARWPGRLAPGLVSDRLISLVDLMPTTLSALGQDLPRDLQGRPFLGSRAGLPHGVVVSTRDRVEEHGDLSRALRDGRYLYLRRYRTDLPSWPRWSQAEGVPLMREIRRLEAEQQLPKALKPWLDRPSPLESLFDMANDPHQIHDLARTPENQVRLRTFRDLLSRWTQEVRDVGFLPEVEVYRLEYEEEKPIYNWLRDREEPLIPRLQGLAGLDRSGVGVLPDLVAALRSKLPAERYWGAVGLQRLGLEAVAARGILRHLLQDPSPVVRTVVARALCSMGDEAEALPVLGKLLLHENQWIRLEAARVVAGLGKQARDLDKILKQAAEEAENVYLRWLLRDILDQAKPAS